MQRYIFCRGLDIQVPEVVETDLTQTVLFEHRREAVGDAVRRDPAAERVDIDIVEVVRAVGAAAHAAVFLLLGFHPQKQRLERRYHRQGSAARLGLGPVLVDHDRFAVDHDLGRRVADGEGLPFKVDRLPSEADDLAAAQPVERAEDDRELDGIAAHRAEKLVELRLVVDTADEGRLFRPLDAVGRVELDKAHLDGVLQRLADVRMAVDDRVRTHALDVQTVLIVLLNVHRRELAERQVLRLEVRQQPLADRELVARIGRELDAVFHQFEPVHEKFRELQLLRARPRLRRVLRLFLRVKALARLAEQGLGPPLVALDRQPCADGFGFSFAAFVLPGENDLIDPVLFAQVSSCHNDILLLLTALWIARR